MFNINSYLDKFKNIAVKEVLFRETIINVINKRIKSSLSVTDLNFKNGIVTIKASPAIKGEIFLKKMLILEDLKSLSEKVIDIR